MNILTLKFYFFNFLLLSISLVFATQTVSAQIVWDNSPSNCDQYNNRSISVRVSNMNKSGDYEIVVYKGNSFIHGSHKVYIRKYKEGSIMLGGIPAGDFQVYLKRNEDWLDSKGYIFKPCPEILEDEINWDNSPSDCDENNNRSIGLQVTNNSNFERIYKITVYNQNQFVHGSSDIKVGGNNIKRLVLAGIPEGDYQLRLERDDIITSTKNLAFKPCNINIIVPDEVQWGSEPSDCDTNNNRSIEALVINKGNTTKLYKIEVYNTSSRFIHGGLDIAIAGNSKKTLRLDGIPKGDFKLQVVSGEQIISATNYVFKTCDVITPPQPPDQNLVQIKTLEPFFTKMGSSFSIDLNNYFASTTCDNINYSLTKQSPGISYQLSSATVNISSVSHFLGKSLLEVTASCGSEKIVKQITIHTQMPLSLVNNCNTHIVNIGIVNFDPKMPQYNNKTCHQAFGWQDPMDLTEAYFDAMSEASGNYIYFNLVEWVYANEFPIQNDGTQFDAYTYDAHLRMEEGRDPTTRIDYPKVLRDYGMTEMVNKKEIDEVWFWGGAFFGEWEASMAGPGAFFVNGGVYPEVESNRPFVFLGLNYERALAEMIHSNGHRAENHIKRAYNNMWNRTNPVTNWDKFTANVTESNGTDYGVGNIHFPPNGAHDYDYDNEQFIKSNALDYINYPNLTGATTFVNKETWGGNGEGYMKFWFGLLPKAEGVNADGRMNNWWKYIYDFSSYDFSGASINTKFQTAGSIPDKTLPKDFGKVLLFDMDDYITDFDVAMPQIKANVVGRGFNLQVLGTKIYAYSTDGFTGLFDCKIIVCDGDYDTFYNFTVEVSNAENRAIVSNEFEISNHPNPFNATTTISYTLHQTSNVSIKIYNSLGELVEVLTNKTIQPKGTHQVHFGGSKYPAGIYYCCVEHNKYINTHKMILTNN